jgi:hypothetical protein
MKWMNNFVDRALTPERFLSTDRSVNKDSAQKELVNLRTQVLDEQQQIQEDFATARTQVKTPKSVSDYFKTKCVKVPIGDGQTEMDDE